MGATERVTWIIPRTVSDRRFRGSRGLEPFAFEGTRARSRNKDGENVQDATTAFKTTPLDEFKKANADFHPIYMPSFDGFVR